MKTLDFPDRHHLNAALGWLELGNPAEARAEANRISLLARTHEETYLTRWRIAAEAGDWTDALRLSEIFTRACPGNINGWLTRTYALYQLNRSLEAWTTLASRASHFPDDPNVPYLLGCLAADVGNQRLAEQYFARANTLGGPNHNTGPLPLLAQFGLPAHP